MNDVPYPERISSKKLTYLAVEHDIPVIAANRFHKVHAV